MMLYSETSWNSTIFLSHPTELKLKTNTYPLLDFLPGQMNFCQMQRQIHPDWRNWVRDSEEGYGQLVHNILLFYILLCLLNLILSLCTSSPFSSLQTGRVRAGFSKKQDVIMWLVFCVCMFPLLYHSKYKRLSLYQIINSEILYSSPEFCKIWSLCIIFWK